MNMYDYAQNLEKIITKDFYPDLPKLEAQAEYLDAVERKDTQKMWELQQKFSRKRTAFRTPGVCKKNLYATNVSYYCCRQKPSGSKLPYILTHFAALLLSEC